MRGGGWGVGQTVDGVGVGDRGMGGGISRLYRGVF